MSIVDWVEVQVGGDSKEMRSEKLPEAKSCRSAGLKDLESPPPTPQDVIRNLGELWDFSNRPNLHCKGILLRESDPGNEEGGKSWRRSPLKLPFSYCGSRRSPGLCKKVQYIYLSHGVNFGGIVPRFVLETLERGVYVVSCLPQYRNLSNNYSELCYYNGTFGVR